MQRPIATGNVTWLQVLALLCTVALNPLCLFGFHRIADSMSPVSHNVKFLPRLIYWHGHRGPQPISA